MSMIEEMSSDMLLKNVIRRNLVIDALRTSLRELKNEKIELEGMDDDVCHLAAHGYILNEYNHIIEHIIKLIDWMKTGDWCFSVENTAKAEEKMDYE